MLLLDIEAWAYNFPKLVLAWDSLYILKYLEILLTSLEDLVGIEGDNCLILASLLVSFSLFLPLLTGLVFEVQ